MRDLPPAEGRGKITDSIGATGIACWIHSRITEQRYMSGDNGAIYLLIYLLNFLVPYLCQLSLRYNMGILIFDIAFFSLIPREQIPRIASS